MGVTIKHGSNQIAAMSESGRKTLKTGGKYVPGDILIDYTQDAVMPEFPEDTSKSGAVDFDPYGLCTVATVAQPKVLTVRAQGEPADLTANYSWEFRVDFENDVPGDSGYECIVPHPDYNGGYVLYAYRTKYGVAFCIVRIANGQHVETITTQGWATYEISCASTAYPKYTPAPGFLRTHGKDIIDSDGNVVVLRSIGLMANDFNSIGNEHIPNTWSVADGVFAEISTIGFNTVRMVFGYQLLESDDAPYVYRQIGWDYLDQVSAWAREHNIKIVLNLHSQQGGTQYKAMGEALWSDPENQNRLVAMWRAIAERYKEDSTFAGWGLSNETHIPLTDKGWLPGAARVYSDFMQRIIDAIRTVDTNHMLFVERALWTYPQYEVSSTLYNVDRSFMYYPLVRDSNMAFEWHDYKSRPIRNDDGTVSDGGDKAKIKTDMEISNNLSRRVHGYVPIFIGEYGSTFTYDSNDSKFIQWIKDVNDVCEEHGYSRNLHTYYGWNKSDVPLNSMGLRYGSSWHQNWQQTTLYEALADVYRNAVNQPDRTVDVLLGVSFESVTVIPSTSSQSITPGSGVDGFNRVTVEPITKELLSQLDSDFVAANIKKGVDILGLTGTLESTEGGNAYSYRYDNGKLIFSGIAAVANDGTLTIK